jgi:hypothetical protein
MHVHVVGVRIYMLVCTIPWFVAAMNLDACRVDVAQRIIPRVTYMAGNVEPTAGAASVGSLRR